MCDSRCEAQDRRSHLTELHLLKDIKDNFCVRSNKFKIYAGCYSFKKVDVGL